MRSSVLWILLLAGMVAAAFAPIPWDSLGSGGYATLFLACGLNALVTAFTPSVTMGLVFSAGQTLPPPWVGVSAGVGYATGELGMYALGASASSGVPRWVFPAALRRLFDRLGPTNWWWLLAFLVAAIPTPLIDMLGLWSAQSRIGLWRFFVPVAAGRVARCWVVAELGRRIVNS